MTQEPKRKRPPSGVEGAAQTALIMRAVKQARIAKDWSAEHLAAEMSAAGVPWTRDIVVNLENGRRNSLAVHEFTTLAYILDAESPLDLLVAPLPVSGSAGMFPVTPATMLADHAVRAWFRGETGPLRQLLDQRAQDGALDELKAAIQTQVEKGVISPRLADDLQKLVLSYVIGHPGAEAEDPGEGSRRMATAYIADHLSEFTVPEEDHADGQD
jgi:transcriptional regulator with XRE-family HTH domain